MQQNNWIDNVVWGLLLLFLIPSSIVVASWNSLPGARLYKAKIFMEDALLAVAPSNESKASLHVTFTERRFSEAQKLLVNQSSTEGLQYLNAEILSAQASIAKAPTSEAKKQLAKKYVATLQNANAQLEQQRQVMVAQQAGQASSPPPAAANAPQQVIVQQPIYIIQQIAQTQDQINKSIQEVEQSETPDLPVATPIPTKAPTSAPKINGDINGERGGSHYREEIKQKKLKELEDN